jgi:hypothetical protein
MSKLPYIISIKTQDKAVLYVLRSLCFYVQGDHLAYKGTSAKEWENNDHTITFKFSKTDLREKFLEECNRLLPQNLFKVVEKKTEL